LGGGVLVSKMKRERGGLYDSPMTRVCVLVHAKGRQQRRLVNNHLSFVHVRRRAEHRCLHVAQQRGGGCEHVDTTLMPALTLQKNKATFSLLTPPCVLVALPPFSARHKRAARITLPALQTRTLHTHRVGVARG
jgi:hypothetical protein